MIDSPRVGLAASPFHDAENNNIYYTDAFPSNGSPQLFCYDIDKNEFHSANVKNEESTPADFCFPIKGRENLFLVGLNICVYVVEWNGCSAEAHKVKKIFCGEKVKNRLLSEAKCDPTGRLYVGTYNPRICDPKQPFNNVIYSYDKHRGLQEAATGYKTVVGLAWSVTENCFFSTDACTQSIKRYTWNPKSGELCKKREV